MVEKEKRFDEEIEEIWGGGGRRNLVKKGRKIGGERGKGGGLAEKGKKFGRRGEEIWKRRRRN